MVFILASCDLSNSAEYITVKSLKLDKHVFSVGYSEKTDSSLVEITFRGKEIFEQKVKGKFTDLLNADINKDRGQDFFLIVNDSDKPKLYGFTVKREVASSIIKKDFPGLKNVRVNTYTTSDLQLLEELEYTERDGKRKTKRVAYNLVNSERGLVLLPQGRDQEELSNMTGQYVARDGDSENYKVLLIGEREGGQWAVSIKTKKIEGKEVICEFSGLGEYVDGDLFVPLRQVDPKLKGTLRIRFIDLMAVVYTNDIADNDEMTTVCKGTGSIAGNFKKTDI